MKTKRFVIFRNIFFILMALVLVGGLTAGWRAATSDSGDEPAQFRVRSVTISPGSQVKVGEAIFVTAYVENIGGTDGIYIGTLTINDRVMEENKPEVEIPAGETVMVTFLAFHMTIAGTYDIEMGGWKGTLEVTPVEE